MIFIYKIMILTAMILIALVFTIFGICIEERRAETHARSKICTALPRKKQKAVLPGKNGIVDPRPSSDGSEAVERKNTVRSTITHETTRSSLLHHLSDSDVANLSTWLQHRRTVG